MFKIFFKLILIIFVFFISIFVTKNIHAFEFVRSTDNPLPVSYINNYASQLQVNIFKEGDIFKGIFVINRPPETYYSLGYFESVNGIDWIMKKEILNTGADLSNPSVIKTATGYLLFITRYDNNTVYRIYSSPCDFDFNCSSNLAPVVMPDTGNNSESNGVFAGHPFAQDSRTFLFFGAWGGDGFKIKLAYSDDLISWYRCPNAFLYGGDGPFPYRQNNDLYLFFHRSDGSGIKLAKTILPLSCDSVFEDQGYLLIRERTYDLHHMIFPSVISINNGLRLYYSGLGNDYQWRLNLACTGQACRLPTPTETPTPTPEKIPVIIIPGMMASWNRDAILHNKTASYNDWKLLSFVKEYEGLIKTFKTVSYQENIDLFLFPYDWRQSIEKTVGDLNNYLQEKIWNSKPDQKVNLVGHSLGGLIARIFAQKNTDKVNKIISLGSPHQGVVQVYKPLEAGEIDRDNTFLWLAEKIVLILNKSTVESDRETIANKFPVAKDLFPTFNFLKDLSGNEISVNSLTIKNSFLTSYNQNFSDIFPMFTAVYGEKDKNTPSGFTVESPGSINQLLGNYKDGQPKTTNYDLGDYTVLSKSASQDTDSEKLNFDHEEIITKKEAIKKILDTLKINYSDNQIFEGEKTIFSPSLIFLIKSPGTMMVEFNGSMYAEDEGVVFIPNAQSGSYNLKVQGTDQGRYEVVVGQISENNDIWESINGEINQSPASSQIDNYNILYNNKTALSISSTPTVIPIPTEQINLSSTAIPTSTPTTIPQSTNPSSSTNNVIPISKEPSPEILGISSRQEEFIIPTTVATRQTEAKKETKKSVNIWDYIWPPVTSLALGGIAYIFRKKILKNEKT